MIGFLKRWFATKSEVESVYSQLDTIAIAIQELRKDQQMRRDAELDSWRPEVTFNLKRTDDLKPRKVLAKPVVVEAPNTRICLPSSLPRHIAEARVVIGKAGGTTKLKQGIANGTMRVVMSGPYSWQQHSYQGRMTVYDKSKQTETKEVRYSMSFKTQKQVKDVSNYLRSAGITFKETTK